MAVADAYGDPHGVAGGLPVLAAVEELIAPGSTLPWSRCPPACMRRSGLALAEAGVHTLVEKPIATPSPAARSSPLRSKPAGLVGAVGHIERYNPALQSLRARLESGELGEIYQIATRRQGPFPARIADVGVVKDLGTHDIDLTAWLAQAARFRRSPPPPPAVRPRARGHGGGRRAAGQRRRSPAIW